MPDGLIEELSKDMSRLASLVLHSARKQPRPRRLTALLTNRWFNGYAGHDPPGRAAVCGLGFPLLFLTIGLINLGWLGWLFFAATDLQFDQQAPFIIARSLSVLFWLIDLSSKMRDACGGV